jgi:nucleotide-binding universal stress UspA family protein
MFQRIVVPLDGSRCAEQAIPVAAKLARAAQGSIVFLRVVVPKHEVGLYGAEPAAESATAAVPSRLEIRISEADQYLSSIATIFRDYLSGIKIETEVETGKAASTIASTAGFEHADLMVLCRHEETGFSHWVGKHIANQIMRQSPVPMLILKQHDVDHELENLTQPLHVLVPLDGSELAEAILAPLLPLVAALSPEGKGTLHLLRVIDVPVSDGNTRGQTLIREHEQAEAQRYLDAVTKRLQEEDQGKTFLTVTSSVIISSDVPTTIRQQATTEHCDLIALATHGRSGLLRVLLGSVTEQVIDHSSLPLLVTRPQGLVEEQDEAVDQREDEQAVPGWIGLL